MKEEQSQAGAGTALDHSLFDTLSSFFFQNFPACVCVCVSLCLCCETDISCGAGAIVSSQEGMKEFLTTEVSVMADLRDARRMLDEHRFPRTPVAPFLSAANLHLKSSPPSARLPLNCPIAPQNLCPLHPQRPCSLPLSSSEPRSPPCRRR